jgi:hypothetical protein
MKYILFILSLVLSFQNAVCQKFYTNNGIVNFDGSKAAFEPIKATNNNTVSIIDSNTGQIAAVILISEFEFRLGLMQEHFNENYLESNVYPKSTFEGVIKEFDIKDLSENKMKYEISGTLTIKGQSKNITTNAEISKLKNQIQLKSGFSVMLSDFDIKIPKIVFKKIDEEVKINLNFVYDKKQ